MRIPVAVRAAPHIGFTTKDEAPPVDLQTKISEAANSPSKVLQLGARTWNVSSSLTVPSDVTIYGVGQESIINYTASSGNVFEIDGNGEDEAFRDITLANLKITASTSGAMVYLRRARYIHLERLFLEGDDNDTPTGIMIRGGAGLGTYGFRIYDLDSVHCDVGIDIDGDPGEATGIQRANGGEIRSPRIAGGSTGIKVQSSLSLSIITPYIADDTDVGLMAGTKAQRTCVFGGHIECNTSDIDATDATSVWLYGTRASVRVDPNNKITAHP